MSEGNSLVTIVVTKSGESETQVGILFCTREEEAIGTYESVYNSATSLIPRLLKRSLGTRLSAATIYCTIVSRLNNVVGVVESRSMACKLMI